METKEMEVFRKKVQDYSIIFADYIKMAFPEPSPKMRSAGFVAEKRLELLMKDERFQELRTKLQELLGELETLFVQISKQPKIARKYAEELRLVADLLWLWEKPIKIVRALENIPCKS